MATEQPEAGRPYGRPGGAEEPGGRAQSGEPAAGSWLDGATQ